MIILFQFDKFNISDLVQHGLICNKWLQIGDEDS